jgi:hypothetical protein
VVLNSGGKKKRKRSIMQNSGHQSADRWSHALRADQQTISRGKKRKNLKSVQYADLAYESDFEGMVHS